MKDEDGQRWWVQSRLAAGKAACWAVISFALVRVRVMPKTSLTAFAFSPFLNPHDS